MLPDLAGLFMLPVMHYSDVVSACTAHPHASCDQILGKEKKGKAMSQASTMTAEFIV